jgi:WD40 repeat protein
LKATSGEPDGEPLSHGDQWVFAVAFSRDGRAVLTADYQGTARLWEIATRDRIGPEMRLEMEGAIDAVAISPDGKTAVTGGHDRRVQLWDLATGRPIGTTMQHRGPINSVAFSPDSRTILVGSVDGTAQLWDVATGQRIGTPMKYEGPIKAVAFHPDGRAILIGSRDGTARLCPMEDLPDDLPSVTAWVEALTGLTLDASGSIRPLDRDAGRGHHEAAQQPGGRPAREPGPSPAPARPDRQRPRAPEAAIRAK